MRATAIQCIPVLFMTTLFAGCMAPAQNRGVAQTGSEATLGTADWARVVENDRASVRAGQLPKEVIQYDLEVEKMIPEGQDILAAHDQARGRVWSKKINSIIEARNKATQKFSAQAMARNNALANALGNNKPDPCLSPMGKNICNASPAQHGDSVHYSAGPGGIGATIGNYTVGPGGIGAGGF